MTTLREAAQQALEALEDFGMKHYENTGEVLHRDVYESLKSALVEDAMQKFTDVSQEIEAALAEPVQEPKPVEFDHGIGADRFKVVRGAFWWHVLIGDSPTKHGKFHSRASAEKMAADLLREFRNGAFVQHEAALAEPVQEPVAWRWGYRSITTGEMDWRGYVEIAADPNLRSPAIIMEPLYTAPPQRPAEPVQEPQCNPHPKAPHGFLRNASHTENRYVCQCEYWEPYEAGYQAGMEAALRAQS